jgi:photosynthetic reaction center cytochrome c subunit
MSANISLCLAALAAAGGLVLAGCERPPVDTVQGGYRGLGMVHVSNPRIAAESADIHRAPAPLEAAAGGGPLASETYQNVQVLGDLSVGEFTRAMVAITNWVSPQQGCAYCHAGADLASDSLYTKMVARRMLEMTRHINTDWNSHVADTGVTCFTCHRGQPVPSAVWFADPGPVQARGPAGNRAGQNAPEPKVGLTSLPFDPFTLFLDGAGPIRVASNAALPAGSGATIQQTEQTYALMMHVSQSLGVNCTFCHNTRSFFDWDGSTPQRTTAWHGIRMVRDLNQGYLEPLTSRFPPERLGPLGDVAKVSCATCHQGVSKPLYGAKMMKDHPELAAPAGVSAPSSTE